jgi:hypothetical protein
MSVQGVNFAFQLGSNTTLDCQGHSITEVPGTVSFGISTYGTDPDNVVLKNCILDGFPVPITFFATHFIIEGNQIRNTTGMYSVTASGSGLIRRNTIRSRLGPLPTGDQTWTGISATGVVDVIDNTVIIGNDSDLDAARYRSGILVGPDTVPGGNDYSVVGRNLVYGGTGRNGTGIGLGYFGFGYRNVVVTAPGADRQGMTCPQNANTRFGNLIIGGDGSPEVDCSTNLAPRLKAMPSRHSPLGR